MPGKRLRIIRVIGLRIAVIPMLLCILIILGNALGYLNPAATNQSSAIPGLSAAKPAPFWHSVYTSLVAIGTLHWGAGPQITRELVLRSLEISSILTFGSLFVSALVGIPCGIFAALKPRNPLWQAVSAFCVLLGQVPPADMAVILIFTFSLGWHLIPLSYGWGSVADAILPIMTVACFNIGYIVKYTEAGMREVMQRSFIAAARARGAGTATVVAHHALRPALTGLLTFLGPQTPMTLFCTVIAEQAFAIPGIGTMLGIKVTTYGTPAFGSGTTLSITLFIFGLFIMVLNLLIDIAYLWLNPLAD
ncbi:peptide/nickel transport system permease protein [Alicyclobacillus hesperidum]|uniref:Peptide/nickel transport system permease protein n=1 Tax=Alicyclobacillus hesperidum TaxID=89784 RepID=A0A1H2STH9_9BACL|nr:ABC transporter permease [Alicyclobacillus hesperidum]SDW34324.1 peptide/nickel transport system permease protein [Alicyclobacillus hesperidum]